MGSLNSEAEDSGGSETGGDDSCRPEDAPILGDPGPQSAEEEGEGGNDPNGKALPGIGREVIGQQKKDIKSCEEPFHRIGFEVFPVLAPREHGGSAGKDQKGPGSRFDEVSCGLWGIPKSII
jgi:hypothetical protein